MACIEDRAFAELSAGEWHDIAKLRVDVFVVEQHCAYTEFDGRDLEPAARHAWVPGSDAGRSDVPVASYARALREPSGATQIGRVVSHPSARRHGLAAQIIDHLMRTTDGPWILNAQAHLENWYAGFGFSSAGEPFDDCGILHVPMRREVAVVS